MHSCEIQEFPKEIGNLTRLEHLDLSDNGDLKEMPENICALRELRYFDISKCRNLCGLPQGIQQFTKLEILHNKRMFMRRRHQFPDEAVSHLIHLCKLDEFRGKLCHFKKLNQLRGRLELCIPELSGTERDVVEAREAEMNKKERLQQLKMEFSREEEEDDENMDWVGVLDALEPHQKLDHMTIHYYGGAEFPKWVASPHNQVKKVELWFLSKAVGLPPFGKLPCLEVLRITFAKEMEFLGGEFLGVTRRSGNGESSMATTATVLFPVLKELRFHGCSKWKKWEDITVEEEASTALSLFLCLQHLSVSGCPELRELPHRLLCKASSLKSLYISDSAQLKQHYDKTEEGSAWNSISHIPNIELL